MITILELIVVAGLSVFLMAVMITMLFMANRTMANTFARSDARREIDTALDGVVSEVRNARGLARCVDAYETVSEPTDSSECRKIEEGKVAIHDVSVDVANPGFCYFSYSVADPTADQRVLRAPQRVCLTAEPVVDAGVTRMYKLELQRFEPNADSYFFAAEDFNANGLTWVQQAKNRYDPDAPRELIGYVSATNAAGTPVAPFEFLDDRGQSLDATALATAGGLQSIRLIDINLSMPYEYRVGDEITPKQKLFVYSASVALRGAIYEDEQTWTAIG